MKTSTPAAPKRPSVNNIINRAKDAIREREQRCVCPCPKRARWQCEVSRCQ